MVSAGTAAAVVPAVVSVAVAAPEGVAVAVVFAVASVVPPGSAGGAVDSSGGVVSAEHIAALKELGPCPAHRRSFIRNFWP